MVLSWLGRLVHLELAFMRKMAIYPCVILILTTSISCAQQLTPVKSGNEHHQVYKLKKRAKPNQPLTFPDSFTAFALETQDTIAPFKGVKVVVNEQTKALKPTPHPNRDLEGVRSEMIMMPSRTNVLKLDVPSDQIPLKIHLLDAKGQGIHPEPQWKRGKGQCEKPVTIPQEDWRKGLPEPSYNPIKQDNNHVIVHHSAGNTGDTNTRQVIRNIYLYHTNVNGWSDIGYNFVIGVNGRIYQARDGLGEVKDHRVKGAHFCGKNSGTMGVALVGNFEKGSPTTSAIQSLKGLLAWKLDTADLPAMGAFPHPTYDADPDPLKVISGHRDGCATLCPGENLYSQLPEIRAGVKDSLSQCQELPTGIDKGSAPLMSIHQKQGRELKVTLKKAVNGKLKIFNLQGKQVKTPLSVKTDQSHYRWSISNYQTPNLLIVVFQNKNGHIMSQQKILLS